MKNADGMVKKILHEVDTNGDGKIQYEGMDDAVFGIWEHKDELLTSSYSEFRTFVEQAERQLLVLFKSIDKDGNGKLDMRELQAAFKGAKLTVSNGRLSEFFNDMDMNNDGYVSFDEWRQVLNLPITSCFLVELGFLSALSTHVGDGLSCDGHFLVLVTGARCVS